MVTWLGVLLLACSGSGGEDDGEKDAKPVTVVNVQTVEPGVVVERLATMATVEAERSADLVPVAPGIVRSIHADEGDPVSRGELLAVLESVSLQAGVERSRAEVGRLQSQVAQLEALHAQGAVSEKDLDDLRYQLRSARVNAAEASKSFGQTRITAPFDGVVARRDARVGELASGSRVFQVVDLDSLLVRVDLPERDVARVEAGQPARLTSAYDEEVRGTGTIDRVSPVIDPSSGTFRVTVDVDDDQPLRPGQFVKVELEVDRHEGVLVVPRKAVLWEDGRPHVFVMGDPDPPEPPKEGEEPKEPKEDEKPDGPVAKRRSLTVGLMDDTNVEVLAGVERGDQVVVVGQSNLKEGARIRTASANARAVPAEAPAEGG
ncbi:MAG: efflux RND transporter periplasmic adaptor subunit [Myxococcales bacterium]|nr:efflux RND transporter periplasmic adaptor subunit [Myxococcales bacterium]